MNGTVPLKTTSAGAVKAYFPYSGTSMYDVSKGSMTQVPGGTSNDKKLYSLGGVSQTNIIAFKGGPYVTKTSSSENLTNLGYVFVGDKVSYTIKVGNSNIILPDESLNELYTWYNVKFSDPLPGGLSLASAIKIEPANRFDGSGEIVFSYDEATGTITANLGNIRPEQEYTITFDVYIGADVEKTADNTLLNIAYGTGTYPKDKTPEIVVEGPDEKPFPAKDSPVLKAEKTYSSAYAEIQPGDTIVYTITTQNIGTLETLQATMVSASASVLQ